MKKLIAIASALLCLLSLAGCDKKEPDVPSEKPPTFSEFLDNENFVPELSQADFMAQLDKYSYEGQKIEEIVGAEHSTWKDWSGWSGNGEQFGFNSYTNSRDDGTLVYCNRLYTEVPLEGLVLPYGITFEDSAETVLEKCEIDFDIHNDFDANDEGYQQITISDDGSTRIVLGRDQYNGGFPYRSYVLTYLEYFPFTRKDGTAIRVSRRIQLSFSYDNVSDLNDNHLCEFEVYVEELDETNKKT